MKRLSAVFDSPGKVVVRRQRVPRLKDNNVRIKTIASAISRGTELLFYEGQVAPGLFLDNTITGFRKEYRFPLKYGYSAVGRIEALGRKISRKLLGKLVFAFNPHESHFIADPQDLIFLPVSLSPEQAIFLPAMETVVSLVMDAKPVVGERIAVFGQGTVGLLLVFLLSRLLPEELVTFEPSLYKREVSVEMGAHRSLDPVNYNNFMEHFDLVCELSGKQRVLERAIDILMFSGRILVGSWYGDKQRYLTLGTRFHRNRVRIISSQVSSIDPALSASWTKKRRLKTALNMLNFIDPRLLITHRFDIRDAKKAYGLLRKASGDSIQTIFTYPD